MHWLLLIYTVPRSPSRKRAYVWRELKKLGALYLRDGVAALPESPRTLAAIEEVAARVREYEGRAIVVQSVQLDPETANLLVAEATAARQAEYDEIAADLTGFLDHVARERAHRELTPAELEELEGDLDKLRRWLDQVRERDYVAAGPPERITALLEQADEALATFLDEVFEEAGKSW